MAGPGDVSGRAVRLNFPRIQQQQPQTAGTGGAGARSSAGRRSSGQTSFNDAISAPEGIQLDQAGIYQETYKAYGALRNYLATARAKGIDPLQGPDPNVPESFAVVNEWNRAVATYEMMLERGRQGLDNLNYVRDAVGSGEMFAGDGILSGDTGVLSQEETIQNTTVADPSWLNRDVNLLKTVPDTEAQYNEMVGYRERRVADMQRQVEDGSMTDKQFQYYLSKLPVPAKYTAPPKPVRKSERSERTGPGNGPTGNHPEFGGLIVLMNDIQNGKYSSGGDITEIPVSDLNVFGGGGLFGDASSPITSARAINSTGNLELTFTTPSGVDAEKKTELIQALDRTRTLSNMSEEEYQERRAAIQNGDSTQIKVFIDPQDLAKGLQAVMTPANFRMERTQLGKEGFTTGDWNLERSNARIFGDQPEEQNQNSSTSTASSTTRSLPGMGGGGAPLDP